MLDTCEIPIMLIMWLVLLGGFLIISSPLPSMEEECSKVHSTYHQILMDEGTLSLSSTETLTRVGIDHNPVRG